MQSARSGRAVIGVLALVGVMSALGCAARVGTSSGIEIPANSRAICEDHCRSIGLPLDSVVIMADNVGCVCREKSDGESAAATGAATSAAAGAIAQMIEDQRRRDAMISAAFATSIMHASLW